MLVSCAACSRHVRSTESACPFCGAAREPIAPRETGVVVTSRAAFLAGGVALAALAGCNSTSTSSGTSGIAQPYGAPPNPPQPVLDAGPPPTPTTSASATPSATPSAKPTASSAPIATPNAPAPAYGAPPPTPKK